MKFLSKKAMGTSWTWWDVLSNPFLLIVEPVNRKITLELDVQSAVDLRDLLYGHGEYIAAGSPLPSFDSAAYSRLGAILGTLETQLQKVKRD